MSSENAIFLGNHENGKPLYAKGYQHILLLAPHGSGKGVCLLMDEFYSVGKLEMFTSCLPYFRGYKIKLFLISSNIGKIEEVYGENETKNIISDCPCKIAFGANNYKTANLISEICQDREKIQNCYPGSKS